MTITININNCIECNHSGHSGAFTPGGAIYICRHSDSPKSAEVEGVHDFNDITTKEIAEEVWKPKRLNDDSSIPNWCPLKRRSFY